MEPQIIDQDEFTVLGVMIYAVPPSEPFGPLWQRFMSHINHIQSLSTDSSFYGVYFDGGEEGKIDYLAGMRVENVAHVPEGLVMRQVPAARYAAFECSAPQNIGSTYGYIFGTWLPASSFEPAVSHRHGFDRFFPDTTERDSAIRIYMPIKEKE